MNLFYTFSIGIGGIIIGLLTFADEIAAKIPKLKFLKILSNKILFFLLGSGVIIWATIAKDNFSEENADIEKHQHQSEIYNIEKKYSEKARISDSIHEKHIQDALDSSYVRSIKASNEALANYNLKVTDSMRRVANTINASRSNPQLSLRPVTNGVAPVRLEGDSGKKHIVLQFITSNSTSYKIRVTCFIVSKASGQLLHNLKIFKGEKFIISDVFSTRKISLKQELLEENALLIILIGEFCKDPEGKQKIPYRETVLFFPKENAMSMLEPTNYQEIIDELKKRNINF